MRTARLPLLLAVSLLLLSACSGAGDRARDSSAWWSQTVCGGPDGEAPLRRAAPEEPAGDLSVGVQFHGLWTDYTDAERVRVLDMLRAAGTESVRIDVSWAMLQPDGPGGFSEWGVDFVDRVLDMANERGLDPLVMLWLSPDWATGGRGERSLPEDPADFGRVAQWAADRWRGQVAAWEVWNEPNDEDFMRGADPAEYVRVLHAAYCGFKTAAPDTPVVFGGTSYVDTEWVAEAYDAGAGGWFDVMGTHPYMGVADAPPETPDDGTGRTLDALGELHELMADHGDGDRPIWITELGWSSHRNSARTADWGRGVSPSVQADYLVRALDEVRDEHPYVARFYWYRERDKSTGHLHDDNFGLLTEDLRPKPAYEALVRYLAP
jgi:hypothetical protein